MEIVDGMVVWEFVGFRGEVANPATEGGCSPDLIKLDTSVVSITATIFAVRPSVRQQFSELNNVKKLEFPLSAT